MKFENIGTSIFEQVSEMFLIGLRNALFKGPSSLERIIEAIDAAFQQTYEQNGMEWRPQILREYLEDNDIDSIDTLLDMTSDKMKEIMRCYPRDEAKEIDDGDRQLFEMGLERITDQWIMEWRNNCLEHFAENSEATNYLLLKTISEERLKQKEDDDKRYEDIKQLAQLIKDDINKSRRNNMYDNLTMLNRSVYPFVKKRLTPGCSDMVIDIAYALTDIYDHVSEYEKSEKIGDLIYGVITHQNQVFSIKQLRMLTGCTYSIAIAKVNEPKKKKELLEKAKERFQAIEEYIENWIPDDNDKRNEFLGMFESDYGALYTNMADFEKDRNREIADKYWNEALKHQERGEEYRKDVYESRKEAEQDVKEEKRVLYQSKSNIAGLLYRMGKYDDAIEKHKEVLKYREKQGGVSDIYLTREYIAGAYIEKWKEKTISDIEKQECLDLLNLCKEYYEESGDNVRLKNIIEKLNEVDKLD